MKIYEKGQRLRYLETFAVNFIENENDEYAKIEGSHGEICSVLRISLNEPSELEKLIVQYYEQTQGFSEITPTVLYSYNSNKHVLERIYEKENIRGKFTKEQLLEWLCIRLLAQAAILDHFFMEYIYWREVQNKIVEYKLNKERIEENVRKRIKANTFLV